MHTDAEERNDRKDIAEREENMKSHIFILTRWREEFLYV